MKNLTGFGATWIIQPRDILNDPFENVNLGSEPDWKVGTGEQYTNAVYSIS